jgi:cold shock CspA family protein/ribosome-associated translation inhibitor RaiA
VQLPLQITSRDVTLGEAEEGLIREAAAKLDQFWGHITSCRVMVAIPRRRGHTGQRYNVRIDIGAPGGDIVVRRQLDESLTTAVQAAFQAAQRRVQDRVRRVRGDVKLDRRSPRGTVTKLVPWEGYGFITDGAGREIYFHRNAVLDDGFDRIEEGMDVRFAETMGDKGPQASAVAPAATPRRRAAGR